MSQAARPKTVRFPLALVVALALTLLLAFALQAWAAGPVVTRMSDQQQVTMAQLTAVAERSNLVLFGESHDNPLHHELQLSLIRALWARKNPIAIGLEMIESESQRELDLWVDGKLSEQKFLEVYARNWSENWNLYRDIFIFARDNRIPMVGLNIRKELVSKVARQGFASLTPEERKNLPAGTSCDLNNPHTDLLRSSFREVYSHVNNSKTFTFFCEAQTLRNSGMAMNIDRYWKKHPGTRIVALAGIWHAVKNAIPEQLERQGSKITNTVILPDLPELKGWDARPDVVDYMVRQ